MKTLFLLIAIYTLSGKQAVPSGDIPDGATCEYEQSGTQTGQMTAGNYIRLTLYGYEGMTLNSVSLKMHSNKDSGAGSLKMTVGESAVWTINDAAFNTSSWAGKYSKDLVTITHSLGGAVVGHDVPISLYIIASQNSLYLQSVELDYSAPAPKAYTVSFAPHIPIDVSPVTEEQPGVGVVLPVVPLEDAEWQFLGWAIQSYGLTENMPGVNYAGTRYYPTNNCTLHAVYVQHAETQPWLPTADLTQGDYLIALYEPTSSKLWHAVGAVENGMIATVKYDLYQADGWVELPTYVYDENAVYTLDVTDDILTITHKATNTGIYLASGGKFAKTSASGAMWTIEPMEVETDDMPHFGISGVLGGKTYYVSYSAGTDGKLYFRPVSDVNYRHDLLLYAVNDMDDSMPTYTSFPFGGNVADTQQTGTMEYRMQIGPGVLTIKNGKKYLQINE